MNNSTLCSSGRRLKVLIIVVLLGLCASVASITINPDGGYNLVIAIDENAPLPPGHPIQYLSKLRFSFQVFSAILHYSTKQRFYINHIDIVVPRHWGVPAFPSTTQYFQSSEVRVSEKYEYLRVDNPHMCGQSGNFIEVPVDLFDDNRWNSKYGGSWKALLAQWARFRYGVWEEHGYPGDAYFPYYYQLPGESTWEPTGCSDEKINGEYLDLNSATCNLNAGEYPGDDCRFHPYWNNTHNNASTSVMYVHWLESVTSFCDEESHNRYAPNRQNKYCDHRSAWEVIRNTIDYSLVTAPPPADITLLDLYTFTESEYPRLMILLDMESNDDESVALRSGVQQELLKIFDYTDGLNGENVVKINLFPAKNIDSEEFVETGVEWDLVGNKRGIFRRFLNDTNYYGGQIKGDFSVAIASTLQELALIPNEIVLLIVRSNSDALNNNAFMEEDLITRINEKGNVRLHVVDITETDGGDLRTLTESTRGVYTRILLNGNVKDELEPVVQTIVSNCNTKRETKTNDFRKLFREPLEPDVTHDISLDHLTEELTDLEIYLTAREGWSLDGIFIQPYPLTPRKSIPSSSIVSRNAWNSSITYSLKLTNEAANNRKWRVYYNCKAPSTAENLDYCPPAIAHIYGCVKSNDALAESDNDIDISVWASVPESFTNSSEPFVTLFASAFKNGQPVTNLHVTGSVTLLGNNVVSINGIEFSDDGLGYPDRESQDGVYSAIFVPTNDGTYDVNVIAQANNIRFRQRSSDLRSAGVSSSETKLFLPDQQNFGCAPNILPGAERACAGYQVSDGFYKEERLRQGFIQIRNITAATWGKPLKTNDLQGIVDPTTGIITLTFTSPTAILLPDSLKNDPDITLSIYHSQNLSDLQGPIQDDLRLGTYDVTAPGTTQILRFYAATKEYTYYAIHTFNGDIVSESSNIVALQSNVVADPTPSPIVTESMATTESETSSDSQTETSNKSKATLTTSTSEVTTTEYETSTSVRGSTEGSSSSHGNQKLKPVVITGVVLGCVVLGIAIFFASVKFRTCLLRRNSH